MAILPDILICGEAMSKRYEITTAITVVLIAIFFLLASLGIDDSFAGEGVGASFFPKVITILILGLGIMLLFQGFRTSPIKLSTGDRTEHSASQIPVVSIIALSFFYVAMIFLCRYWISTAITMFLIMYIFGNRGWLSLVFIPLGISVLYYAVFFRALRLFEPSGFLFDILMG